MYILYSVPVSHRPAASSKLAGDFPDPMSTVAHAPPGDMGGEDDFCDSEGNCSETTSSLSLVVTCEDSCPMSMMSMSGADVSLNSASSDRRNVLLLFAVVGSAHSNVKIFSSNQCL